MKRIHWVVETEDGTQVLELEIGVWFNSHKLSLNGHLIYEIPETPNLMDEVSREFVIGRRTCRFVIDGTFPIEFKLFVDRREVPRRRGKAPKPSELTPAAVPEGRGDEPSAVD